MATRTIAVSKFIGSVSLGLLTGISYTLPLHSAPSLLSLPSASSASTAFRTLSASTQRTTRFLSALSFTSILTAYILSPERGRHPFLLYGALAAGIPHVTDLYGFIMGFAGVKGEGANGGGYSPKMFGGKLGNGNGGSSGASSDEEWEVEASGMRTKSAATKGKGRALTPESEVEDVNGETVKQGIREWSRSTVYKGASWALGFGIMVVGMWGDGYQG
ncbi:uncharacterized protein KY384_000469 [Bacidia gigantensis]|uniref:uncharacterized protein n=1 Tax=Bacidia gigantensis TaxID=2732470 RepID=UPI001D044FB8|nr:uncharacterized protein KY384_000469 [Bacidia gigantensis]KAG8525709.1 hypothetical protein KY384_000469 [Bacidia gigantensis]